jgi:hypothetical protein
MRRNDFIYKGWICATDKSVLVNIKFPGTEIPFNEMDFELSELMIQRLKNLIDHMIPDLKMK